MGEGQSSGIASFEIDVPYNIIETGQPGEKPLIVYLHGYKQNLRYFQKKCSSLLTICGYHLFLQGPYPIYDEKQRCNVDQWGRAWYLYDGEQDQFLASMEKTSVFIQSITDQLKEKYSINRMAVLGYSMGGYLAGYFALSRPGYIDDLMVIGGRIKTEAFSGNSYSNLHVIHVHGSKDISVEAQRSKKSCEQLKEMGAEVTFTGVDEGHKLNSAYIKQIKQWMLSHNYKLQN